MKHIRCRFFFSESGECRYGDKCPYSHSKKTPERGRDASTNPRRTTVHLLRKETKCAFSTRRMGSAIVTGVRTHTLTLQHRPRESQRPRPRQKRRLKLKPSRSRKAKRKLSLRLQPFANHTYDDDISECSSLDSDADSDCSTDDEHVGRTTSTRPKGKKRVLFANDVRFQSSKPRRSYKDRGDKIVKVDVKERFENDNKVNELGFSMHTARLKAQMMTDMV